MKNPIITSLLDTDLYKFTMMQCVLHHFKTAQVAYRFKCRKPVDLTPFLRPIQEQIKFLCTLRFSAEELSYLQSLPYFTSDFIAYLTDFQLNEHHVEVYQADNLELRIHGPWIQTILFEVPLLAIISETYYQLTFPKASLDTGQQKLQEKIQFIKNSNEKDFNFSDFGTRRRYAKAWHETLLFTLKENLPQQFIGTSNVYFAQQLDLKPIGTMAHEFLQACQVLSGHIKGSQAFALNTWLKEYEGALGIALTDVLTFDIFLSEFNQKLAQQYSGLRQDSGDPIAWGEKALKHYQSLGIDPHYKTFIFSDSLTFPKALALYQHFKGRVLTSFGIGTNLTNDVGFSALDIVIKMVSTNHLPVIKISDSPGKIICEDPHYLETVKKLYALQD